MYPWRTSIGLQFPGIQCWRSHSEAGGNVDTRVLHPSFSNQLPATTTKWDVQCKFNRSQISSSDRQDDDDDDDDVMVSTSRKHNQTLLVQLPASQNSNWLLCKMIK